MCCCPLALRPYHGHGCLGDHSENLEEREERKSEIGRKKL